MRTLELPLNSFRRARSHVVLILTTFWVRLFLCGVRLYLVWVIYLIASLDLKPLVGSSVYHDGRFVFPAVVAKVSLRI